jgi:hypothetical protein
MASRIVAGIKRVLRLQPPRRSLLILPDDIFLVSYPKSGNTWTRFLLANLLFPERCPTFKNLHQLIPDPYATAKRELDSMPRPRVIKSHECFDPRYPKVIYITRDPRDVVVSQYHYHRKLRKIGDNASLEEYVSRFLAGQTCIHGSWGENAVSWLVTQRAQSRLLLLRYEDMLADTLGELAKIASFLNIPADGERLASAVERSSAGEMRKLEKSTGEECKLIAGSRKDLSFVRAAKAGGWRSELPGSLASRIEAAWGPIMLHLGYTLENLQGVFGPSPQDSRSRPWVEGHNVWDLIPGHFVPSQLAPAVMESQPVH